MADWRARVFTHSSLPLTCHGQPVRKSVGFPFKTPVELSMVHPFPSAPGLSQVWLWGFFFSNSFIGIKFTYRTSHPLKVYSQWLLIYSPSCTTIATVSVGHLHDPWKTPHSSGVTLCSYVPPALGNCEPLSYLWICPCPQAFHRNGILNDVVLHPVILQCLQSDHVCPPLKTPQHPPIIHLRRQHPYSL